MAHEVTQRADGRYEAAYAFEPAWHGNGTVVSHLMTSEEIIKEALLDWGVEQFPMYAHGFTEDGTPMQIEIPNQFANVRSDTKDFLGIVSDRYQVVENAKAFEFVDALHQDGIIKYDAAGSLRGGKIVWLLAHMPEEFQLTAEDKLEKYILFQTAHDGTRAVRVLPTSVRVVCMNTLTLATTDETKGLTIRHKGNIMDKLDEAKLAITEVNKRFESFHNIAQKLMEVPFDLQKLEAFANILVPDEPGKKNTRRIRQRESILAAFTDGPQNLPGVRGTAWAAFNAVTQHVDHNSSYHGKNNPETWRENRMDSLLMGANARFKQSALNLLVQAVA